MPAGACGPAAAKDDLMTLRAYLTLLALTAIVAACGLGGATRVESPALENGSFTAELNGFQIHYEVHGQGPVVMTLPNSWGLTLDGLRALYRPLEQRVTMVYFDPRGMGGSEPIREPGDMGLAAVRADFDALRQLLGLERVHAIGWSNGAMNLILLALEQPETLSSATFVHSGASFTEEDAAAMAESAGEFMARWAEKEQELAQAGMPPAEADREIKRLFIEEFFPLMAADREFAAATFPKMYAGTAFSFAHLKHSELESTAFDFREQLADIPVRSLVIAGTHDLMPADKVRELADGLPDARFVVFYGSGHFAPVEEPEKFARTVFDFLGV
jgi:proline iminopeptidase